MEAVNEPGSGALDHLVFTVPDLEHGVHRVEDLLGVRASPGGRHEGLGTHNRLIGLEGGAYLEVVAPDPDQPAPARPRWFGLDEAGPARLATWCVRSGSPGSSRSLEAVIERGRHAGIDLGSPVEGGRLRPDGSALRWTFSDPWADRAGGVVPFFIDWGDSAHPSTSLAAECRCVDLRVEHPDADRVRGWLRALGLDTEVRERHAARIVATIESPNGVVELS